MRSIPVARVVLNVAHSLGVTFQVDGRAIDPLVVMGASAYLPLVAYQAEGLAQEMMGWTLGVRLEPDSQGVFGLRVPRAALEAHHFQGSIMGLMYLKAAETGFGWNESRKVDLHQVYARHAGAMAGLVESNRRERAVIGV